MIWLLIFWCLALTITVIMIFNRLEAMDANLSDINHSKLIHDLTRRENES